MINTATDADKKDLRVVIVGGGFGGLTAAKELGNKPGISVILIDKMNHHLFQPLLYQVAMAGLNPADIAVPIRSIIAGCKNVTTYLGEVLTVDRVHQNVTTNFAQFSFDYLILACGACHSYFGNEQWEPFAPGLKTIAQATEIRRRVLMAFELAEREPDEQKRKKLLTVVIVGGGPTGVELAGALGEMTRHTLTKDFKNIDPRSTRVILIEGGSRILPQFSIRQSRIATHDLEELGVQVWVTSKVDNITKDGVQIGQEHLDAATVIWAAGVKPPPLNAKLGINLTKEGLVPLKPDLTIEDSPTIFVVGDQGVFIDEKGRRLTGLSPIAIQQAECVVHNILADRAGKPRKNFKYFDKGKMATIGRRRAVAQIGTLKFSGFIAWLAWLFVHIYYLIGFKNRVLVMIQWAISYFTFRRGARLIVDKEWQSFGPPPSK